MKVRIGTLEDIELIIQLHHDLNKMLIQLQPDDIKNINEELNWVKSNLLNEDKDYLLIEDEGEVRGLALVEAVESCGRPSLLKRPYVHLVHLIVNPMYRGCGYGHELLKAVKEWGMKRKVEYVELSVLANNQAALMFYEKEGLINISHVMRVPLDNSLSEE